MRSWATVGVVLCLLGGLSVACQPRPATPTPTAALPTPAPTWTPTPIPGPLTDDEAIALAQKELAARGVALETVRIAIAGEPRTASVRYTSAYQVRGRVFEAQTILITLVLARIIVQVQPAVDGGLVLSVIPGGESEEGLRVIAIESASLEAWANGALSDEDFVQEWTVGIVTTE